MDVTVRGAGVFGLGIAWACAQRGARVQVIDPHGPGAGASGGVVGALAPHVPENWNPKKAFQLRALLAAERFWAEIEDAGGMSSGYGRLGRLQPVSIDGLNLARARGQSAAQLWEGRAVWDVVPSEGALAHIGPWMIHDTLSGRIHPRRACDALVCALEAVGVPVLAEGTDRGQVIWATGADGLRDLSEDFGQTVGQGIKGQAVLLDLDWRDRPQLFVGGLHVVPHADGTVAVGSTTERVFDDGTACDGLLDALLTDARAAVPALADAPVLQRWAGIRPRARSRAPILGAWPGRAGHFVANGGFKIGFGVAPEVARVMADLVLEGRDGIPDGFRVGDNLKANQART
ncbi:FAD-binding oxidoreductase [Maribius pontilimi]|uniref:FAD-binding oxidoreductase n=1 Tax=Palleronia pontilimi TaxID=1964209 RepID=A0A934MBC1_9RHOB|nr:FAD-binding oxidoreductase [Palleronia pontilimi]MBJ3761355.1 FAD-binding oxidoreductase [Palleronia pontilimi]